MNDCPSCGEPIRGHALGRARVCLEELRDREPPYCRLTGPADPGAWATAVAAHTLERLEHPERFER